MHTAPEQSKSGNNTLCYKCFEGVCQCVRWHAPCPNDGTMDKMTEEQRHRCMAAIHSRDTKPELVVRKFLFSRGFRYRLNHPRLPGRPDIVLRRYRTVIFVNGCFWHGHEGCRHFTMPKSRTEYWQAKIERNRERDKRVTQQLTAMGWHCITIWECQLLPKARQLTLESLEYTLSLIYLGDRTPHPYAEEPDAAVPPMAAEPDAPYGPD